MTPQTSEERHLEPTTQAGSARSRGTMPAATPSPALTAEESSVMECLRQATTGLTMRQLRARVSCGPDALEQALATLVEREMIARLNTIIPSYSYRRRGAPTDEG